MCVVVLGNVEVIGYVECISLVVDVIIGIFKVILIVLNYDGWLKVGMFFEVVINYFMYENVIFVLCKVLLVIDNSISVFVIDNGIVKKMDVIMGFEDVEYVEIISGLSGNEIVVIVGYYNLKDVLFVVIVKS